MKSVYRVRFFIIIVFFFNRAYTSQYSLSPHFSGNEFVCGAMALSHMLPQHEYRNSIKSVLETAGFMIDQTGGRIDPVGIAANFTVNWCTRKVLNYLVESDYLAKSNITRTREIYKNKLTGDKMLSFGNGNGIVTSTNGDLSVTLEYGKKTVLLKDGNRVVEENGKNILMLASGEKINLEENNTVFVSPVKAVFKIIGPQLVAGIVTMMVTAYCY